MGFPCSSVSKESACSAGNLGLIPGSGRSPGEGNGNSLQYSCLENSMDRPWGHKESDMTELLTLSSMTNLQLIFKWKAESLPAKIQGKTKMPTSSIRSPSHSNQTIKTKVSLGREQVKFSSYADEMILYTENLKDSTIKLLALINSAREQDATLIYRNQFL